MINFNSVPQTITAAVGALFISTMFVTAAVGPVQAAPSATAVQSSVQAHA